MSVDTGKLLSYFAAAFGRQAQMLSIAPGRVNLIGEHTDYNEGFVLPVAIDRTVAVAAAVRDDGEVAVRSLDYGECDEFDSDPERQAQGGWKNYVRGVVWALEHEGHHPAGADLAIAGDVPQGAGLSSSAAIEVAVAGLARVGQPNAGMRKAAQLPATPCHLQRHDVDHIEAPGRSDLLRHVRDEAAVDVRGLEYPLPRLDLVE